jgi:hypothetical protein
MDGHVIVRRFEVTPDIPREIWELFAMQNADADMLQNGLVFAVPLCKALREHAHK